MVEKIITSKSVGKFNIGDLASDLKEELSSYDKRSSDEIDVYVKDELLSLVFKFIPRRLVKICVLEDDIEHKFLDKIGIGSTMAELEAIAGPYYEELDTKLLKKYPNIAFDLGDRDYWPDDYWDEKEAPIIAICVCDPKVFGEKNKPEN